MPGHGRPWPPERLRRLRPTKFSSAGIQTQDSPGVVKVGSGPGARQRPHKRADLASRGVGVAWGARPDRPPPNDPSSRLRSPERWSGVLPAAGRPQCARTPGGACSRRCPCRLTQGPSRLAGPCARRCVAPFSPPPPHTGCHAPGSPSRRRQTVSLVRCLNTAQTSRRAVIAAQR